MKKHSLLSAFLGTLIEVYDFTIFPFLIPILSKIFFPLYDKNSALNFTILAFVISYIVKPFGAIGFGYLIDRFGSKKVLIFTTLLMTIATLAIGLLPPWVMGGYYGLGLITCRIIQGYQFQESLHQLLLLLWNKETKNLLFQGA